MERVTPMIADNIFPQQDILILGSRGQIGSSLSEYYSDIPNTRVFGVDIVNDPVMQDLRNPTTLYNYALTSSDKFDMCYFLAWDVGGARYIKKNDNTLSMIRNNMRIMDHTFGFLEKTEIPFVFVTSQMSNMLHSAYGLTKNIGEKMTTALQGVNVKLWNVYGIEHDQSKFHVISDFVHSAITKRSIKCMTDGNECRQFLYTRDLNTALHYIHSNYSLFAGSPRPLDISTGEWVAVRDIAEIVRSVVEKLVNARVDLSFNEDAIDNVQHGICNEPIQDSLLHKGWKPEYSLEEGIQEIASEYLSWYPNLSLASHKV